MRYDKVRMFLSFYRHWQCISDHKLRDSGQTYRHAASNTLHTCSSFDLIELSEESTPLELWVTDTNLGLLNEDMVTVIHYDLRKYTNCVIPMWNCLSDHVVSAETVNTLIRRLDKFWSDQDVLCIRCTYKAYLHGIANRSMIVYGSEILLFSHYFRIWSPLRPASVFSM